MTSTWIQESRARVTPLGLAAWLALGALAPAQLTFTGPAVVPNPEINPLQAQHFGQPLAASGDAFVVGHPTSDAAAVDAGRALVYTRGSAGWILSTMLLPSSVAPSGGFGRAIDFAPGRIVVSEIATRPVHVFDLVAGVWTEVGTLAPPAGMPDFGVSVLAAGNAVLVGAPLAAGRVVVFTQSGPGWVPGPILTAPGTPGIDGFGESMATNGTVVAIGARQSSVAAAQAGAVFLFQDGGAGFVHVQTVLAPTPAASAQFGFHVDLDGDTLIVGELAGSGHAYVYTLVGATWTFQQELVPPGPRSFYGVAVQVRGDVAVVRNANASPTGVEVFQRQAGVWSWSRAVPIPAFASNSLALTSSILAAGCPNEDANRGVVQVFDVTDPIAIVPECFGDGTGTSCPCANSGGPGRGCANSSVASGAWLEGAGIASLANDTARLDVTGTGSHATGLFFQGTSPAGSGAGVPFGDGLRCAGGTIARLAIKTAVGGASSYPGAGDAPISVRGAVPATGGTRHYQLWYRDVASFCTPSAFNLTNGVRIEWTP